MSNYDRFTSENNVSYEKLSDSQKMQFISNIMPEMEREMLAFIISQTGEEIQARMPLNPSLEKKGLAELNQHNASYEFSVNSIMPSSNTYSYGGMLSGLGVKALKKPYGILVTPITYAAKDSIYTNILLLSSDKDPNIASSWEDISSSNLLRKKDQFLSEKIQNMVKNLKVEANFKRFYSWYGPRKTQKRESWMAQRLTARQDPELAWKVSCDIAEKTPSYAIKETWDLLALKKCPAYDDISKFALWKDENKLSKALERNLEVNAIVVEQRIKYAKETGMRIVERSDMIPENREKIKTLMIEGNISITTMNQIGNRIYNEITEILLEEENKKRPQLTPAIFLQTRY